MATVTIDQNNNIGIVILRASAHEGVDIPELIKHTNL